MEAQVTPVKARRARSAHLMCGTPVWGIAGVLACSYLAYLSYNHLRLAEFDWSHDALSILTYAVWVLLMAGLLRETVCHCFAPSIQRSGRSEQSRKSLKTRGKRE